MGLQKGGIALYKKVTNAWTEHIDFMILDFLCITGSLFIAFYIRFLGDWDRYLGTFLKMSILIATFSCAVVMFNDSYLGILKRRRLEELSKTSSHVTFVVFLFVFYLFLSKEAESFSRLAILITWVLSISTAFAVRTFRKQYLLSLSCEDRGTGSSLLIVTSREQAAEIVSTIRQYNVKCFRIAGLALTDYAQEGERIEGRPVVASASKTLEYVCHNWVDEVLFCLPAGTDPAKLQNIIQGCFDMGIAVHVRINQNLFGMGGKQLIEKISGYTVVSSSINMATAFQLFIKRALDIVGGIVGMLCTGLIYLFIAPYIYIKSPGSAFFSQWRIGKNGKKFKIYKFRTMYPDAEERKAELMRQNRVSDGMMFKLDNDPRIIGGEKGRGLCNFIRKASLDEFPQFWNVLKGDMSLVGTRPPTLDEWEKYDYHHRTRMATKPGLTGMWQVSGRSQIIDFEEVVKLDKKYIVDWSMGLDIKILFKTLVVMVRRDGAM